MNKFVVLDDAGRVVARVESEKIEDVLKKAKLKGSYNVIRDPADPVTKMRDAPVGGVTMPEFRHG